MFDGAIRVDGKVALRYFQPVPKYIKVNNKEYVCDVRHGVSIILAEDEDVQQLLDHLGGCCGGRQKVFHLPNQESVNVWLTGER